jgi:hypothetical protein
MTKKKDSAPWIPSVEQAEIELGLIKENFDYRRLWESSQKDPPLFLRGLRSDFGIPSSYFFLRFGKALDEAISKLLEVLSPPVDLETIPVETRREYLPWIFASPAVASVVDDSDQQRYMRECDDGSTEYGYRQSDQYGGRLLSSFLREISGRGIPPHKRIVVIDLQAKRGQVRDELTQLLDTLPFEDSRYTREMKRHLEVWRGRRKRKTFSSIAEEMGISEDVAKKSFYRAYRLTQGAAYNPETLRRDLWLVRKTELKKTCETCPIRDDCQVLCPDVLSYVDQDQRKHSIEMLARSEKEALRIHELKPRRDA